MKGLVILFALALTFVEYFSLEFYSYLLVLLLLRMFEQLKDTTTWAYNIHAMTIKNQVPFIDSRTCLCDWNPMAGCLCKNLLGWSSCNYLTFAV